MADMKSCKVCDGTDTVPHVRVSADGVISPGAPPMIPCPKNHHGAYPMAVYISVGGREGRRERVADLYPDEVGVGYCLLESPVSESADAEEQSVAEAEEELTDG